jgi:osmotically-inducible protein OsmY
MTEEEPVQYLAARIHEAIAEDSRVHQLDIDVRLVGDKVFLRGQVPSEERRDAIAEVAREVAEDREVHNEIDVIVPGAVATEEEVT